MALTTEESAPPRGGPDEAPGSAAPWRTWCCELELASEPVVRSVVPYDGEPRARVLVRRSGEPVGYLHCEVGPEGLDVPAVVKEAQDAFPTTDAQAVVEPLTGVTVTVVVCTRDRSDVLAACLQRLEALTYRDVDVVIVDNAPSDDRTRDLVTELAARDGRFSYVREPRAGLSRARNAGLAAATGTVIAYTDDDVAVDPGWVQGLLRGFRRDPGVGCVTGLVCTAGIHSPEEAYFDARAASWSSRFQPLLFTPDAEGQSPLYPYSAGVFGTGASIAFDREVLVGLGGFDEALGAGALTRGGEDLDAFVRVLRAGRSIAYEPSAVVWHHHRAGRAALLRQMFGYGSGLTAFVAKCLTTAGTRGEVLRRLPRGVWRLVAIREQTGERLGAEVPAPSGAMARELLGMLVGPLLYLRARWAVRRAAVPPRPVAAAVGAPGPGEPLTSALDQVGGQPPDVPTGPLPATAVTRLVLAVLALAGLAVGAAASLMGLHELRVVGLLLFCTLGIGSAPWQFATRLDLPARLTYTGVTSVAVWTLPSAVMVTAGTWHPSVVLAVVAAITVPLHVLALLQGVAEGAAAEVGRRVQALRKGLVRSLPRRAEPWTVGVLGALLCFGSALTHRHLDAGFGGYVTQIGALWVIGLLLVLAAVVWSRHRPEWQAATGATLLLLVLTATPALVYDGPRSQSAFKHLDLVEQIRQTGLMDAAVDVYDAWPGFFSGTAWLSDVIGLQDSLTLAVAWPALLGLLRLVVLRHLAGQVLHVPWQRWWAVTLAVLVDSIGADYFSPQSLGFVLGLAVFGLALTRDRSRSRQVVVLLAAATIAVTHQLSPFVVAGVVVLMTLFRQVRPWWTSLLVVAPALLWTGLHWSVVRGFLYTDAVGSVSNFRPPETAASDGLERLPIVTATVLALVGSILVLGILALVTLLRQRRTLQAWALAGAPSVALALVAINPYGQEGIFRAALFGIPWLALLAAQCPLPGRGRLRDLSRAVVAVALAGTFLLASSGLDALTVTRSADVAALREVQQLSGDDYVFVGIGTGDLPVSLRPGPAVVGTGVADLSSDEALALDPDERVAWLTDRLWTEYLLPTEQTQTAVYVLWSPVQEAYQDAYGLQTPQDFAALRDALEDSPFWDVVSDDDGTVLFQFNAAQYIADAG